MGNRGNKLFSSFVRQYLEENGTVYCTSNVTILLMTIIGSCIICAFDWHQVDDGCLSEARLE